MKIEFWREYKITTITVADKEQTSYEPLMPKDVWDEYIHEKLTKQFEADPEALVKYNLMARLNGLPEFIK